MRDELLAHSDAKKSPEDPTGLRRPTTYTGILWNTYPISQPDHPLSRLNTMSRGTSSHSGVQWYILPFNSDRFSPRLALADYIRHRTYLVAMLTHDLGACA